jgi:probable rRNA maturation factor
MAILFFCEDVEEIRLEKRKISSWIKNCIKENNKISKDVNIIFCSDEYLKALNIQYLQHDYYTDVITFNYNVDDQISGDIFISLDRISDNSGKFHVTFNMELNRVIIHGVLHLLGYDDSTAAQKNAMKMMEDKWLDIFPVT